MRELIRERGLEDYDFARIAEYRTDRSLNGLTIPQAAQKVLGAADLTTQQEMKRRMLRAGGASMVYHFMSDDDLTRILRHPMVSIASDSGLNTFGEGVPHPRGYGNAVRVLGKYVREQKIITLEEAVRKMTSLPADRGHGHLLPASPVRDRHRTRPGQRCSRRGARHADRRKAGPRAAPQIGFRPQASGRAQAPRTSRPQDLKTSRPQDLTAPGPCTCPTSERPHQPLSG